MLELGDWRRLAGSLVRLVADTPDRPAPGERQPWSLPCSVQPPSALLQAMRSGDGLGVACSGAVSVSGPV